MSPIFKLLFTSFFALFLSEPASAFLWFGGDGEAPKKSPAIELLNGCFGNLTNLYPPNESSNPVSRGNLRKIRTSCSDGFTTNPSRDLYVLPKIENGHSVLYIMDDKDGKLRVRKFPIAATPGRSESIEISDKDYDISCTMNTNTGGGPETLQQKLVLTLDYNNKNSAGVFRVTQAKGALPQTRQRVSGKDDLGPHITQSILEEAAKDATTLNLLPRGPAYTDSTVRNIEKSCRELANSTSVLPSGQESDGSLARIEAAKKNLLSVYEKTTLTPSYDVHKGSSGGPAGSAVTH